MVLHELLALAAVLMIATGTWLRWRLPSYCSDAEEDAKDGKITGLQARSRITLITYASPVLTVTGLVLLVVTLAPVLGR